MKVIISVGGKFHAIELASQLHQRGYLETLITTKSWYAKGKIPSSRCIAILAPEILAMAVRKIPFFRRRGYYSYIKDNLFDALARKYISPCDIFHAWGNYAYVSIPFARKWKAKIVIERGSTHPYFQDEILREECARYQVPVERAHPQIIEKGLKEIELADRVIIPSEFVRRSFMAHGVHESKLACIPYGIDPQAFTQTEKKDAVFRVLFVGNVGIQKGVHYLLEAWSQMKLKNAELVFIGSVEEEIKPMLAKHSSHINLRGHVPHEKMFEEFSNASVFILPSLQEGSALVTYEAMACGTPSIVSENTGAIVRDNLDGFVIPIRSSQAIKEKILWMYEHPDEAKAMGASAKAFVQNFTWSRYADRVVEVYRSLLN